jgi:ADP-ribosylation factor GTPase-activating protein 1
MDSFKSHELALMGAGGNRAWLTFYDAHPTNRLEGRTFEDATIAERYDGAVGEEWKERLAAKVEGREYVAPRAEEQERRREAAAATAAATAAAKKKVGGEGGSRTASPAPYANAMLSRTQSNLSSKAGSRSASPALGTAAAASKKAHNEAFFARMGAENAARPDDLPPSQGGKYAGFGSGWSPPEKTGPDSMPTADEFQKDPVTALTRGFGWLSTTVGKAGQEGLKRVCLIPLLTASPLIGYHRCSYRKPT